MIALAQQKVGRPMAIDDAARRAHLYRHRGLSNLLLGLLESEQMTQTVTTARDKGKVTRIVVSPVLAEYVDFAPILDAFQSLTPGQRIVWLAIACAIVRVSQHPPPARWEQRTHANGKLKRYSESEVQQHYGISTAGVYRAWMKADNVMGRAFRDVEWQFARARED